MEIPVSEETRIHYKDQYYLRAGNASNFKTNTIKETANKTPNKFIDFFYEDVHAYSETDEKGNYVGMRITTKKELNWFKVGACSTSIALIIIGAIMLIKKHK